MSTTSNESTEPTFETKRDELKDHFKDNSRPRGSHFEDLIDSSLVMEDENLTSEEGRLTLDKNFRVNGELQIGPAEDDPSNGQAVMSGTDLNLNDELIYKKETHLKAFNALQVNPQTVLKEGELPKKVTINPDEENALHTTGDVDIDGSLDVSGALGVTGNGVISGTTTLGSTLTAQGTSTFEQSVTVDTTLVVEDSIKIGDIDSDLESIHESVNTPYLLAARNQGEQGVVIDTQGKVAIGEHFPTNELDVNGSVYIGDKPEIVEPEGSLSVQQKIGVGTPTPQALLDIKVKSEELAMSIRQNEENLLEVLTGTDNESSRLNFAGHTEVDQTLTVDKNGKFNASVNVADRLTAQNSVHVGTPRSEAEIEAEAPVVQVHMADGMVTASADITADGALIGTTLDVKTTSVFTGGATFKNTLLVEETLTAKKSAKVKEAIAISSDEIMDIQASLHIKENENRSALRVDNDAGASVISVKNQKINFGATDHDVSLSVQGTVVSQDLLSANKGLDVVLPEGVEKEFAADIQAKGASQKTLNVQHGDTSLIKALSTQVGVLCNVPDNELKSPIQLGDETLVEGLLTAENGLLVTDLSDESTNCLIEAQDNTVTIGKDNQATQFNMFGTSTLTGSLNINNWATIDDECIAIEQKQSGAMIKIEREAITEGKSAAPASSLGMDSEHLVINVSEPGANLDINGTAHIHDHTQMGTADVDTILNIGSDTNDGKLFVSGDLRVNAADSTANSDVVIEQSDGDKAALNIGLTGAEEPTLFVKGEKVGINTDQPCTHFEVKGDSTFDGEVTIKDHTDIDSSLDVTNDLTVKSDLTVKEKSKLEEQTVMGVLDEDTPKPMSQLYIADNQYAEALRIDSKDHDPIVVKSGRMGIGVEDPRAPLDVKGNVNIDGEVDITQEARFEQLLHAKDNATIDGVLTAKKDAFFDSCVHIKGDLHLEDNCDLIITGKTHLTGNAEWHGILSSDVDEPQAKVHYQTKPNQRALQIENADSKSLLMLNEHGQLGLGNTGVTTNIKLNVEGDANVTGEISAHTFNANEILIAKEGRFTEGLKLGNDIKVHAISSDHLLGGDSGSDGILPTQAAVKKYVDNVAVPFGRGGKTFVVSSQESFDKVFNTHEITHLSENITVILLPLNNQNYGADNYKLKRTVQLRSGVSIIGFNPATTRICKDNEQARFELVGSADSPVTQVNMEGFTYDGRGLERSGNGGAFYLKYANHCTLNCRIENHRASGDGGGLYGEKYNSEFTVTHIEARHIYRCHAAEQGSVSDVQRNEGGAAYGLKSSTIGAYECKAEHGGAVAFCDQSKVVAVSCHAKNGGGAAYRSKLLQLQANDCSADLTHGKGGGALFCSDLICVGQWTDNRAAEADNIYAVDSYVDNREEHYWKGDYVGRRIDDGEGVWLARNI